MLAGGGGRFKGTHWIYTCGPSTLSHLRILGGKDPPAGSYLWTEEARASIVSAMRTDTQLLEAYASKDNEAAFAELARRHGSLVYRTCLRAARLPGQVGAKPCCLRREP